MQGQPDAPSQKFRILRKILPKALQPSLRGLRKWLKRPPSLEEPFRSVYPYTQCHLMRQHNLLRLAHEVDANNVPGAIVECGVLDGGTAAIMAYGTQSTGRPVHLFDSWEGLPAITSEDGDAGMWSGEVVGSPKRVIAIFKRLGIDLSRVTFHKGWFDETFPNAEISEIALLHADGDFYASVKSTIENWAPHMSNGGYMQFDDYDAFIGCRRAVDEFISRRPDLELSTVERGPTKAYFIKF